MRNDTIRVSVAHGKRKSDFFRFRFRFGLTTEWRVRSSSGRLRFASDTHCASPIITRRCTRRISNVRTLHITQDGGEFDLAIGI